MFDTRQPEFGAAPLGFATSESWSFADFTDSVQLGGVPLGAQTGFIGNLTGTGSPVCRASASPSPPT